MKILTTKVRTCLGGLFKYSIISSNQIGISFIYCNNNPTKYLFVFTNIAMKYL